MALLDDGDLAKTIAQALNSVMGTVILSRTTPGEYDPATSTVTPGSTETWSARGMIEDFDAATLQRSQSWLAGSIIKPGDRKATLLAHGMTTAPKPSDHLIAGGRNHLVISVTSDPAGATWNLLVR